MRARPHPFFLALVPIALTTSLLTACGDDADHSFAGQPVLDLEKSLSSLESSWRQEVTNSDVKTRVPEDARCYFQVDPQEVDGKTPIGQSVLCGPYREMGAESTAWDVAQISAYPFDDKGNLTIGLTPMDRDELFEAGEPSPNLTPWRPDGEEADLAAEVPEPDAPLAEAGTVLEIMQPADLAAAKDELRTPHAAYSVERGIQPRVDGPDGRMAAPEGGTFVIYRISGQMGYGGETDAPTFQVTLGDDAYDLPGTNGTWAVSIPGDGADAVLAMTFDGLTQTLDANGVRAADATADPLYDGDGRPAQLTVASLQDEQGDYSSEGWSGRVDSGWSAPSAQLTPYTSAQGWAPEGKIWLLVEGTVSASGINHRAGDQRGSYDLQKVEVTTVSIDGEAVQSPQLTSERNQAGFSAAVAVDPSVREFTLGLDVHVTALRSSWADEGLPDRGEIDFALEGPITR